MLFFGPLIMVLLTFGFLTLVGVGVSVGFRLIVLFLRPLCGLWPRSRSLSFFTLINVGLGFVLLFGGLGPWSLLLAFFAVGCLLLLVVITLALRFLIVLLFVVLVLVLLLLSSFVLHIGLRYE